MIRENVTRLSAVNGPLALFLHAMVQPIGNKGIHAI
ncbi:hypothetical protein SHAL103562_21510 [Shewanella algae]